MTTAIAWSPASPFLSRQKWHHAIANFWRYLSLFMFGLKHGPGGNLLHGPSGNLVHQCGGECPCNSTMPCHLCPSTVAAQFHVTFTDVALCTSCVNCPVAGLSFSVTAASRLNGTYVLARNGECAWTAFSVDVPCTANSYASGDCSGAATSYSFAIQQVRISATQFELQVVAASTPILLFSAIVDVASCCSAFMASNALTSCGCAVGGDGSLTIALGSGGMATVTPC